MIELGRPEISSSAFVDRSATVLGNVRIGEDVYVAPNATIRADEPGSMIIISKGSNVQDNVVIHALRGSTVEIGAGTTLAHGSIVHGPCTVGPGCFIGFGSTVFQCTMMDGCVVLHHSLVTKALIPPNRLITSGSIIEGNRCRPELPEVPKDVRDFVDSVLQTNLELVRMYRQSNQVQIDMAP